MIVLTYFFPADQADSCRYSLICYNQQNLQENSKKLNCPGITFRRNPRFTLNPVISRGLRTTIFIFFRLAILLSLPNFSKAQSSDLVFQRFGFQLGLNISNMNFNKGEPPPETHINASWKTGFTFGFQLKIPVSRKFLIQTEYSYSERNGEDQSISTAYRFDYFSLPVLLNYSLAKRLHLIAGPQFGILISAKSSVNGIDQNITHDVEERDVGILVGLEYDITNYFFFSARYLQGLNHVGIRQDSGTKEFVYELASLTAGIRF